jgi:hypothetical protein
VIFEHSGERVVGAVVHDVCETDVSSDCHFGVGRGQSDRRDSTGAQQADEVAAEATNSCVYNRGGAGGDARRGYEERGREPRDRQGRRKGALESGGNWQRECFVDRDVLRTSTIVGRADHRLTDLEPGHIGSHGAHVSGEVRTRDVGMDRSGWWLAPLFRVPEIQSSCFDLYQHVGRSQRRKLDLADVQNLRLTGRSDERGAHLRRERDGEYRGGHVSSNR